MSTLITIIIGIIFIITVSQAITICATISCIILLICMITNDKVSNEVAVIYKKIIALSLLVSFIACIIYIISVIIVFLN